MKWEIAKLGKIAIIRTGKLDSNAAVIGGRYPFFTCDPNTLSIDVWAYDTEAVLLAGNNASGNYTAKYYKGKFNAYQRTYIIESADEEKLNIRYFCYALNQQLRLLKTMSSGSTTKFLTVRMLDNLDIPLPSINIQTEIVNILSAYDDLIENNQKQIKLLEEAAQRLYKEWFVDLRFPGHENTKIVDGVPEGWSRTNINEILTFHRGYDLTKNEMKAGRYPVVGSTTVIGYHNEFKIKGPGIVTGHSGSLGKYQFIWDNFWPHNTSLYISDYKDHNIFFVYSLLQTVDFASLNNGGAIPTLNRNVLSNIEVIEPTDELQEMFAKIAEAQYRKIRNLEKQNNQLKMARDVLLPKLMSGEVEV